MKTYIVQYVDGWLHQSTFEVEAENIIEAWSKANEIMNLNTLDQNNIQAIETIEEKQ